LVVVVLVVLVVELEVELVVVVVAVIVVVTVVAVVVVSLKVEVVKVVVGKATQQSKAAHSSLLPAVSRRHTQRRRSEMSRGLFQMILQKDI
jgi:hypothetical protein